ncbi:hypothetical protein ACWCQP_46910 [Streptomyces chartreusis]
MTRNLFSPVEPNPAEGVAKHFVQVWAEAVLRQAERTREIRQQAAIDSRNHEHNEDWSASAYELEANFRAQWAEEHMLVWAVYQLERWRARLAKERGEKAPPENQALRDARNALEHLDEAHLDDDGARSPVAKGGTGRALRNLPDGVLRFSLGGGKVFEVLDAERLDEEALAVVASINDELDDQAMAMYEDLIRGC